MDKFASALRGYNKKEVNAFIDNIIIQVESMVDEIAEKDKVIADLEELVRKNQHIAKELAKEVESLNDELAIIRDNR